MGKIKFLLARARNFNMKSLSNAARDVARRSGKPASLIAADMLLCAARYGAAFGDYRIAEFWRLTHAQRATHITRGISNQMVRTLNKREYWNYFDNKVLFNKTFKEFVFRDWLDFTSASPEEAAAFAHRHKVFIAKPIQGTNGLGVRKVDSADYASADEMYGALKEEGTGLLEQIIPQHEELNRLYPTSVNTLRIVTLMGNKKSGILYTYIRIGNGGRVIDNINGGGMIAPWNSDTGIITHPATDKALDAHEKHPTTKTNIIGFKIPYFAQAMEMCLAAAEIIPQIKYVAWDVAVTPKGPELIEGNAFPGHDVPQFFVHNPDGIGIMPRIREFIDI